jgi:hypothetical protein
MSVIHSGLLTAAAVYYPPEAFDVNICTGPDLRSENIKHFFFV